ncbi:PREDICTED: putative receptor-like protein kinase At3g47110 isoform X3 [Ipomoea nil]|uniref:putative receptor-like protein kinase At3g47110 isoform X3 n=1 Tax=Ipomoea nil TaxID=35883 RepID=UPI000901C562|nr:PREDICTED: putative receptor-like protein kinase At3g47110 isoform X3 [Ipomoea nil]
MSSSLFCFYAIFAFLCKTSFSLPGNVSDHQALLSLKANMIGGPFQSWNESTHFCNWVGITCGRKHQRVVTIDLHSSNLQGSLSPAVGNLSFLRELSLDNNTLSGIIPNDLGRLRRLSVLVLERNVFSGEIPKNLSHCVSLTEIYLGGNNLTGTFPLEFRSLSKLVNLTVHMNHLMGEIPAYIGNFSSLKVLSFAENNFKGKIPKELGRLRRLSELVLERNVFSGEIPKNLSHCVSLTDIFWAKNNLTGTFPLEFRSLSKLEYLSVHTNHLMGEIPAYIGNFSSLKALVFSENNFKGKIPTSIGCLQNVFFIGLGSNYLSSTIPVSIFNLSSLVNFDVRENKLEGYLPSNLGTTIPKIDKFWASNNLLRGLLPISMSNATGLRYFDVSHNDFYGGVPSFSGLKRLIHLSLIDNPLGNGKSTDLDFMSSLLNSTATLLGLYLNNCNFGGVLPRFIANFPQLVHFQIKENVIGGYLPSEIHLLENLEYLYLSENQLGGTIPSSWGGSLQQLIGLHLGGNKLFGEIPISLGNLSILSELYLPFNEFQGTIPISFENFRYLLELDLSNNKLQGNFPKVIFTSLVKLDLSHNHFTGPLPVEIGGFKNLVSLNLSNNMFLGTLPSTIGALSSLIELNINHNLFHGLFPPSFSSLKNLEILDLSCNNLTGKIPEFLGKLKYLKRLNLSFNHLEGEIPTEGIFKNKTEVELVGNNLCGGIPQFGLTACPREGERQHLSHIQKLAIFIMFIYKQKNKQPLTQDATTELIPKLSYWSIQKATNEFSKSSIIGFGKFSTVYKGILDGSLGIVAIKVFKLQVRGASKSFLVECEALRQIRHRNLVKVLTTCCSIDHEGSLDNWLHNHSKDDTGENNDSKSLNLLQRVNIAIDVANALDYLHNQLETGLVHCDLKPSNILLDGDLIAHVADFGIAKFLPTEVALASSSNQVSSSIGIKGTFGYAAPEYGMGSDLSTFGDMYSYGILLLEMFTSKSPTSDIFNNGLTLHNYVRMSMPEQVAEIVDPKLFQIEANATPQSLVLHNQIIECLVLILKIGIACSVELPRDRMSIGNAVKELLSIKDTLVELGDIRTIPRSMSYYHVDLRQLEQAVSSKLAVVFATSTIQSADQRLRSSMEQSMGIQSFLL